MNIAHINDDGEEQSVREHCENTAKIASVLGKGVGLEQVSYLCGILHDMGKETHVFTNYIKGQHEGNATVHRGEINHSSAGARYLYELVRPKTPQEKLTCQLIAYSIAAHHGIFDVLNLDGECIFERRLHPDREIYYSEAIKNYSIYMSVEKIKQIFAEAVEEVNQFSQRIAGICQQLQKNKVEAICVKNSFSFFLGMIQRMLLSIVIDADRTDTQCFMTSCETGDESQQNRNWSEYRKVLERYLLGLKRQDRIALLRNQISKECVEFDSASSGIYRLSCPTGGGKTLASFRYALRNAERFKKRHIIYIAPYRAILEQNCEVIRMALHANDEILEHHSDVIPEDNERYQYLSERYTAPIIFTTMVQFLNTLFSNQTKSIRRFHNFSDSIIIIDEVQSIPVRCIHLFNQAMNFLAQCCNTNVILCTATQPSLERVKYPVIFQTPSEIITKLDEKFEQFRRVNIIDMRIKKGYSTELFREMIFQKLITCPSVLVIVNTKEAARKLYESCKEFLELSNGDEVLLYHLSTNMCPQHRIDRLNDLRIQVKSKSVLCISTQLIEAGVDISFSCVIRSFTGLDSIAQAAGRCNRNGETELGEVIVVNYNEETIEKLEDIKEGQAATGLILEEYQKNPAIFDGNLLSVSAMQKFYERYYFSRIDSMNYPVSKYNSSIFDMLSINKKGMMSKQASDIESYPVLTQAYETAGKSFEVIDSNTIGILVPYHVGKAIITDLNNKYYTKDVTNLLKRAQRYTINVFQHTLHKLQDQGALYELAIGGIYALKDGFYNETTGLQLNGYFESLFI